MSPFEVETIALRMLRDVYSDGGQIQASALAAIETACWDIIGKATGQPLYNLIGGRCYDKLRCYANGWYRGPRTPESFHGKARAVVQRGYTALKFDPFGAAWRTVENREFDLALEIIAAVHAAQGPVCSVVCAHLNAATPNFYIHEIFDEFNEPWEEKLLSPPMKVRDGHVSPPDDPGLGVELDLDEVSKHPYRQGNWLPLFKQDWERREGGE